jgi:hypothetical protein
MNTERMLPRIIVPGLPLSDQHPIINRHVERFIRYAPKGGRGSDTTVLPIDFRYTGSPEAFVDELRDGIIRVAEEKGPVGVITMSASVPVGLTAVRDLGEDVVAKFVGVSGPVGSDIPQALIKRASRRAPGLLRFMEVTFLPDVLPTLRERVHTPTLGFYGTRDGRIPPPISDSWADINVPIRTPSHIGAIALGLRSTTLRNFLTT